jgi:hypothetical protein
MYKYRFSIDVFLRNFLLFLLQEEFYGREVILADRDMVETQSGKIQHNSNSNSVENITETFHPGIIDPRTTYSTIIYK